MNFNDYMTLESVNEGYGPSGEPVEQFSPKGGFWGRVVESRNEDTDEITVRCHAMDVVPKINCVIWKGKRYSVQSLKITGKLMTITAVGRRAETAE